MYAKERKVISAGEESTAALLDSVPAHTSSSSIEKETMQYKRRKVISAGKESRAAPQDSVPTHTSSSSIEKETMQCKRRKVNSAGKESRAASQDSVPTHTSSSSIEKETMQYKRRKVNSAGKESTAAPAPQDLVPAHASSSSIDKETMYYKRRKPISAGEITTAATVLDTVPAHTSSSSTNGRRYEVFLSFRGVDTRTNFTDHLYTALDDAGINTFRDDDEIRMGHELSSELLTAIQQSRISIPVFSRNYADSKWCLAELTKIVECREKMGQIVLPIFYDVEPSDVRNQKGTYAKAFRKHQKRCEKKMVEQWQEDLRVVGSLKGENAKNWYEGKLIKSIVTMVLSELKNTSLVNTNYLVGIQYHVNEMLKLLDVSSTEVRIVGIHGMGGIGKTGQLKMK